MLAVKNLSKQYKNSEVFALKDVSFSIAKGEMVGLIGKNGSGKTTLIKAISKFIQPTLGEVFLNDEDIFQKDNIHQDTGILLEPVFYPQLTAYENLTFYLEVNDQLKYSDRIDSILKTVGLANSAHKKPRDYSFGMKQRLGLAISLITDPKLLVLDEPFVGLDPVGVQDLIEILKNWVETRQVIVMISSHQLNELEELCDRFLILEDGELKHDGLLQRRKLYTFILDHDYKNEIKEINQIKLNSSQNEVTVDLGDQSLVEVINLLSEQYEVQDIDVQNDQFNQFF